MTRRLLAPGLAALVLAACGSASPAPAAAPAAEAAPSPAAGPAADPAPIEIGSPMVPDGYIEMRVGGVAPVGDAQAVTLTDARGALTIPIMIGGTEALSIALRIHEQPFTRPLTHDLLDSVLDAMGARLWKVQVDDLRQGIFIGSVWVVKGGRIHELDARPSDAIALAIGHRVPIYVAEKVVAQAAERGAAP